MRFAVDTGGTFTDLLVEDESGGLRLYKSPTTPDDPIRGVHDVLDLAARDLGEALDSLLGRGDMFIHGTTRAINAILTGSTARTAFLATRGHPDILLLREGGRTQAFDFSRQYPEPYVPRSLTFEVPERIGPTGEIVEPLDEAAVVQIIATLREKEIQAVAVCLLWSVVNPVHENRIRELLEQHLPAVPHTLSSALNPTIREYRRGSSAAIDASLKPVMTEYLSRLDQTLRDAGFKGRVLVATSNGGMLDAQAVARAPIHSLGSGPAMAPIAGRHYARVDANTETAVVADTGGTSYDVSLVRRGRIPWTRETWLGQPYFGHMTGFPSVDVKSVGAGGGSIAWVDSGGLLHVGPRSAGSVPGPACYDRGGTEPTVTDAALVLGYLNPDFFLGGAMRLSVDAATEAVADAVASELHRSVDDAAAAIMKLASEHMVRAIEEITLNQGIDPRTAVLVGGGGAAGLNAVAIARRLGCPRVIIPAVGAALSAAGALMSDLIYEPSSTLFTASSHFDFEGVNATLTELDRRCEEFAQSAGAGALETTVEFSAEARYPHQIWELDVPLRSSFFESPDDVEQLRQDFHEVHYEVFAIADLESPIEIVGWRARVRCRLRGSAPALLQTNPIAQVSESHRRVYFPDVGPTEAKVVSADRLEPGVDLVGPAIIEAPVTTVVVESGTSARKTDSGSISIAIWGE